VDEIDLHLARQRHRKPVDVDFVDVDSLRLEINLVPLAIWKSHDLVFERRAVTRPDSLDLAVE